MKIKDFIKKIFLPDALASKSTDLWVRSKFGQKDPSKLQEELMKAQAENESVRASTKQELYKATTDLDTHRLPDVISKAQSDSLVKSNLHVNKITEDVKSLSNKLEDSSLSEIDRMNYQAHYNCKVVELTKALKKYTAELREFTAKAKGDLVDNLAASSSSNNVGDVSSTKNLESSNVLDNTEVQQSCTQGYFIELKDLVSKELENLSPEEFYCFIILMVFILIFVGLLIVTTILFGPSLIDYFNLEQRLPKLAKFLKLRQIIDKYNLYLIIFIIIYLIVIYFIFLNLYIFI